MKIRDRIVELVRVPASELVPNPKNWRTHPQAQADALRGVLAEVGIADAVIARRLADGQLMLIDGHLRAETLGAGEVPVIVLDVTEAEADTLLLFMDPLASMAKADAKLLDELLRSVQTASQPLAAMLEDLAFNAGLYRDTAAAEQEEPEEAGDGLGGGCVCPRCGSPAKRNAGGEHE